MAHIKGPDFPTGGIILGHQGIRDAYETGRGRVRVQARAHIEPLSHGKEAIIVTELPFQVKKGGEGGLITKIADLVHDKKISEISDLRDESDGRGMRLVIELKRDVIPKVALNKLYKHTSMQSTFGVNTVALVDGVPRTLVAARGDRRLRQPPARGRRPPRQARADREGGAPARPRRPADRDRATSTSHRPDPRLARSRDRAQRPGRAVHAERHPGRRRSSPCACRSSPRWSPTRSRRSTPTSPSGSASCARCSATRPR